MSYIHFIKVEMPLSVEELQEMSNQIENLLESKGRSGDIVLCLNSASYQGSVEIWHD